MVSSFEVTALESRKSICTVTLGRGPRVTLSFHFHARFIWGQKCMVTGADKRFGWFQQNSIRQLVQTKVW